MLDLNGLVTDGARAYLATRFSFNQTLSSSRQFRHFCRDKVSRAAHLRLQLRWTKQADASTSRRSSVFCSPFLLYTVTLKLRCYYRDSYVIGFYRDGTRYVRLPGLAKARQPTALTPSSINICYLFNITDLYLDWAIARQQKTCANIKSGKMPEFMTIISTFY